MASKKRNNKNKELSNKDVNQPSKKYIREYDQAEDKDKLKAISENFYKDILLKSEKRRKKMFLPYYTFLSVYTFIMVIIIFFMFRAPVNTSSSNDLVNQAEIKSQINNAVNNNCDLESLKNIYDNRNTLSFWGSLFNREEFYSYNESLIEILYDLRADYYIASDKESDLKYINKINTLIKESSEKNPFDLLEENQKYYFENIRYKSGEVYETIQYDINKIVLELNNKNDLVKKYLDKSNMSFIISIVALIITIAIGFLQLFLSSKSKQIEIIKQAQKEIVQELEDSKTS